MPTGDVLFEGQVQFERRNGRGITFDGAQLPALLVVFEAEVERAPAETAGLALRHSQDVARYSGQKPAGEKHLAAAEVRVFGGTELGLQPLGEEAHGGRPLAAL